MAKSASSWDANSIKSGDTIQITFEIVSDASDGTNKAIVAQPTDLPDGVDAGTYTFNVTPTDDGK